MACPVLVVDDDEGLRETIADALEGEGYAVEQAPDAGRALAVLCASRGPLVVLLDYSMPGDGGAVLDAVTAGATLSSRDAYILCTAVRDALPAPVAKALAAIGAALLPKPFELEELLDAVEAACRRLAPDPECGGARDADG
jgi:CheY-like chemotaxis protein